MENLDHADNQYYAENALYTKEKLKECALCLKSVNDQIFYINTILKTYPDLFFIALTRNAFALAEGYIRRGMTATEAGIVYHRIFEELRCLSETIKNYKLIKFDDVVNDPFKISEELLQFKQMPLRLT